MVLENASAAIIRGTNAQLGMAQKLLDELRVSKVHADYPDVTKIGRRSIPSRSWTPGAGGWPFPMFAKPTFPAAVGAWLHGLARAATLDIPQRQHLAQ